MKINDERWVAGLRTIIVLSCVTFFFYAMATLGASGWLALKGREYIDLRTVQEKFNVLDTKVNNYSGKIEEIRKVTEILGEVRYGQATLRTQLLSELSECGMAPGDLTLKELDDSQKRSMGMTDGKPVINIDVYGTVPLDRLDIFLRKVSSQPKIWSVQQMTISPKDSSVSLLGRYAEIIGRKNRQEIETLSEQIRKSLEGQLLSTMEVELKILVITG